MEHKFTSYQNVLAHRKPRYLNLNPKPKPQRVEPEWDLDPHIIVNSKRPRDLGGTAAFHNSLNLESDYRKTYSTVDTIRKDLKLRGGVPLAKGKSVFVKTTDNAIKLNDALSEVNVFRKLPTKADTSRFSHLLSCSRREEGKPLILVQTCDVLGQHTCKDCLRARQEKHSLEQAFGAFPNLNINQKALRVHQKASTSSTSIVSKSSTSKLPAINDGKPVDEKQDSTSPNQSDKCQRTKVDDFIVTPTELQRRVMSGHQDPDTGSETDEAYWEDTQVLHIDVWGEPQGNKMPDFYLSGVV